MLDISRREDHTSLVVEENTFITDGVPAYVLCPQTGGSPSSDLVATRNTYYDLSGNEPLMLKYEFGDICFKDWQSYYGYDEVEIYE